MKTAFFPLFLLLAFASSGAAEFVFDTEGNYLKNGGSYYILPHIWALGGGLGLATTDNETCPLTVVQQFSELNNGLPLRISSPYRIAYLPTNFILQISFDAVPTCASTPSSWTIVEGEDETQSVKITGYESTVKGWFKIQKYHTLAYKLVFCPHDADSCGDLGISKDDKGNRRLVITDDNPFVVVFQKAKSSAA